MALTHKGEGSQSNGPGYLRRLWGSLASGMVWSLQFIVQESGDFCLRRTKRVNTVWDLWLSTYLSSWDQRFHTFVY